MKSGVYFVHYDDIDAFLKHIEINGRELDGSRSNLKHPKHEGTYRAFSVDNGIETSTERVGYWGTYNLEAMERWNKWSFTDEYIELWKPRKVIL